MISSGWETFQNVELLLESLNFAAEGVDLMVPINVKQDPNLVKGCVVLHVYMVSRAVHIEIVQSLETGAFIQAF